MLTDLQHDVRIGGMQKIAMSLLIRYVFAALLLIFDVVAETTIYESGNCNVIVDGDIGYVYSTNKTSDDNNVFIKAKRCVATTTVNNQSHRVIVTSNAESDIKVVKVENDHAIDCSASLESYYKFGSKSRYKCGAKIAIGLQNKDLGITDLYCIFNDGQCIGEINIGKIEDSVCDKAICDGNSLLCDYCDGVGGPIGEIVVLSVNDKKLHQLQLHYSGASQPVLRDDNDDDDCNICPSHYMINSENDYKILYSTVPLFDMVKFYASYSFAIKCVGDDGDGQDGFEQSRLSCGLTTNTEFTSDFILRASLVLQHGMWRRDEYKRKETNNISYASIGIAFDLMQICTLAAGYNTVAGSTVLDVPCISNFNVGCSVEMEIHNNFSCNCGYILNCFNVKKGGADNKCVPLNSTNQMLQINKSRFIHTVFASATIYKHIVLFAEYNKSCKDVALSVGVKYKL